MMKKHLMIGTAAIVLSGLFTNCSHDMDSGSGDVEKSIQEKYEDAFKTRFGTPASTQAWGFSDKVGTRGQTNPQRSDIDCPYDDAWMAEYLKTAKEPASLNTYDDVDKGVHLGVVFLVFIFKLKLYDRTTVLVIKIQVFLSYHDFVC